VLNNNGVHVVISSYDEYGKITKRENFNPIKKSENIFLVNNQSQYDIQYDIQYEMNNLLENLPCNSTRFLFSGKDSLIKKTKLIASAMLGFQFLLMYGNKTFANSNTNTNTIPVTNNIQEQSTSLWSEMMPIFTMFQDIIMVVGALAIFGGLVLMMFKKQAGKKFLISSVSIIAACFVVPAGLMLLGIIGGMINDTLITVFQNSNLKDSVNVGGR
jgi:hypothetical protein